MDANKDHADVRTKKILFVTHSERGQSNTILAIALEASTRLHVEVHIASFPSLKSRVEALSPKLIFHPLNGKPMFDVFAEQGVAEQDLSHPPMKKNFWAFMDKFVFVTTAPDGESYVRLCDSVKKTIEGLNPSMVVVDSLLHAAFDACYSLNQRFVISTPNTPLDIARKYQPWLKGLWYYPWMGTGISFPVPWRDLPWNVIAVLVLFYKVATSPKVIQLNKDREAHGLSDQPPTRWAITRALHVICPGVRETDFPLVVPDYLGLYGPIVLDTTPVDLSDPELNRWLDRGQTVLMYMGTHFCYSESQVKAILNGFLSAVGHDSSTQFLWKLPNRSKFENLIEEALKNSRDKERFKIVNWLEADPPSIMMHPNVAALIHHGGANTYFEGALAGVPQIILAQWFDLYDMAARAEYLGIGIYGNRNVAPDIETIEFGTAIARLLRPGEESEGFRTRAKVVAEACRKAGGKRRAVDKLMEITDRE